MNKTASKKKKSPKTGLDDLAALLDLLKAKGVSAFEGFEISVHFLSEEAAAKAAVGFTADATGTVVELTEYEEDDDEEGHIQEASKRRPMGFQL